MSLITLETQESVAILTLNDPSIKNALSETLGKELAAAMAKLNKNADIKVIVIRGAGGAFSSGGHLDMLKKWSRLKPAAAAKKLQSFYSLFLNALLGPKPVIAAVDGPAVGAGCCLALACDLRVARRGSKFSLNFARIGLAPGMAATWLVSRLATRAFATEMLMTAQSYLAEDLAERGLINQITDSDPMPAALELAHKIAANSQQSLQAIKSALLKASHTDLKKMFVSDATIQAKTLVSDEFRKRISS